MREQQRALKVIALTKHIHQYLLAHDPNALEQVLDAITPSEEFGKSLGELRAQICGHYDDNAHVEYWKPRFTNYRYLIDWTGKRFYKVAIDPSETWRATIIAFDGTEGKELLEQHEDTVRSA